MPRLSASLFLALFAGLAAAVPADDAPRLLLEVHCGGCHAGKEAAQGLVLVAIQLAPDPFPSSTES